MRKMADNSVRIKGDNNRVLQNPVINATGVISNDTIPFLAEANQYGLIQKYFQRQMKQIQESHPLSNFFSVTPLTHGNYSRLVSTPKTETALLKYPKTVKAKIHVKKSDFPGIGENEPVWEYAYRTQKKIKVDADEYKEFLGEIEDPFPVVEYPDGTVLTIVPPSFPEPKDVTIVSGCYSIEATIQRIPSEIYQEIVFLITPRDTALSVKLVLKENSNATTITISERHSSLVVEILGCIKLLEQISSTRKVEFILDGDALFEMGLTEEQARNDIFQHTDDLVRFLENLSFIQNHFGCKFCYSGEDVQQEDFLQSFVLSASIEGKALSHSVSGDEFRTDWDRIPESVFKGDFPDSNVMELIATGGALEFFGVSFCYEGYVRTYQGAKVNNVKSVKRRVKKRDNNILISLRPIDKDSGNIHITEHFASLRLSDLNA